MTGASAFPGCGGEDVGVVAVRVLDGRLAESAPTA